jgi:alpha-L-rhamnosidase
MNSFAHYAFGSVGQWMFQTAAGIDTAEPGYQKITIKPVPGEGLDWIKASYRSLHGKIGSAWRKEGGKLMLDVTVPANTTAVVSLPCSLNDATKDAKELAKAITESGKPLSGSPGVKVLDKAESSHVDVEVGAGEYHFVMPWKG